MAARAEAEWFSPQQMEWLARLRLEHANIRAALEFCLSTPGEAGAGLRLVTSLYNHRIGACGGAEEGRHWLGRALALDTEPSPARARALWADGWFAFLRGDTATGQARLAEIQALADTLGDPEALAHAVQFAGLAALFEEDYRRAISLLEDAADRHRDNGDLVAQWTALYFLSLSCCLAPDPSATGLGEECLALCETHGAQWSRFYALRLRGLEQWLSGETARAIALLQDGLRIEHPTHHPLAIAQCLEMLA